MVDPTDTIRPDREEDVRLVPDVVPIFPLPRTVLLPGELLPLHVFETRYRTLTRDALASHRVFGVVSIRTGHEAEQAGAPPLEEVGCLGYIAQHTELPDGRFLLWLVGLEPFRIDEELEVETPYRSVRVTYLPTTDSPAELSQVTPLRRELRSLLPGLLEADDSTRRTMFEHLGEASDSQLVALACHAIHMGPERKLNLLQRSSLVDRYSLLFEDLYAHLEQGEVELPADPGALN
jgi:Lon protease-like protein